MNAQDLRAWARLTIATSDSYGKNAPTADTLALHRRCVSYARQALAELAHEETADTAVHPVPGERAGGA